LSDAFAFGFRTSLFERFCPLAISRAFHWEALGLISQIAGTRVEALLEAVEEIGPDAPGLGAAFERGADMRVGRRRRAFTVGGCESATSVSRIFELSPRRCHLAFRFAAARASRALE
jgi:hypothetical protein